MTFQKVEKVLEIPSEQEKDETGGGQEARSGPGRSARARSRDAGVHARRTSETRGPVISQMLLLGGSGDQNCDCDYPGME